MKLCLGVDDMPYAEPKPKKTKKRGRRRGKSEEVPTSGGRAAQTTGEVAEFLEDKYHVMEVFYEEHENEIADALTDSVSKALTSLIMGAPADADPFSGGTEKIKDDFHQFISGQEVERLGIPGVPTKAALMGVNHRLRHPYARGNPRRPSFRDTGLYETSFQAWMDKE